MAGHRLGAALPDRRANRERQDAGGLPLGNRPADASRPRRRARSSRDLGRLHLSPQGPGLRHRAKPARAPRRGGPGGGGPGSTGACPPSRHSHRRYDPGGAATPVEGAVGDSGDHAGVPVPVARLPIRPALQVRAYGDRGRGPCPGPHQAGRPSGPVPGAALGPVRPRPPAHRSIRDGAAPGGGSALPGRGPGGGDRRCPGPAAAGYSGLRPGPGHGAPPGGPSDRTRAGP